MLIDTTTFGKMEIDEKKILKFKEGIPGFREEKEFIIILNEDEENPLHWLQSVKTPDLAFVIINPFQLYEDYEFQISEPLIRKLNIKDEKHIAVYTIVVVPEDIKKMTTNLVAPIIVNSENMNAKQIILENTDYTTKHYVLNQDLLEEPKGGI